MEKESRDMKFDMLKIGDKVKFREDDWYIVTFFTDEQTIFVVYKGYVEFKNEKIWTYHCTSLDSFLYTICLEENLSLKDRQELYKVNGLEYK